MEDVLHLRVQILGRSGEDPQPVVVVAQNRTDSSTIDASSIGQPCHLSDHEAIRSQIPKHADRVA